MLSRHINVIFECKGWKENNILWVQEGVVHDVVHSLGKWNRSKNMKREHHKVYEIKKNYRILVKKY